MHAPLAQCPQPFILDSPARHGMMWALAEAEVKTKIATAVTVVIEHFFTLSAPLNWGNESYERNGRALPWIMRMVIIRREGVNTIDALTGGSLSRSIQKRSVC